jgi:hypothetical protein
LSLLPPLFQQNREYSARVARKLVSLVGTEGVVTGFVVGERGAGASMSVDASAGQAFVEGDDQANQGRYLCVLEETLNLPIAAADLSNPRVDRVILAVRDPNAGGPAGDDTIVQVLTGTPGGAPVAPAVPDSAISLATVAVGAGATSIFNANVTDTRTFAQSTLAPLPALNDLTDVTAPTPASGDVLAYDGSGWRNEARPHPFFLMGA